MANWSVAQTNDLMRRYQTYFFFWVENWVEKKRRTTGLCSRTHCRPPINIHFGSTSYWQGECAACVVRNKYAFISWHVNFYEWQLLFATSFFFAAGFFSFCAVRKTHATKHKRKESKWISKWKTRNKYRRSKKIANEWWNTYVEAMTWNCWRWASCGFWLYFVLNWTEAMRPKGAYFKIQKLHSVSNETREWETDGDWAKDLLTQTPTWHCPVSLSRSATDSFTFRSFVRKLLWIFLACSHDASTEWAFAHFFLSSIRIRWAISFHLSFFLACILLRMWFLLHTIDTKKNTLLFNGSIFVAFLNGK